MPVTHGFQRPAHPYAMLRAGGSRAKPVLDGYSNVGGAWSVSRRLLSSYTGPLIRIRRSSDSTEQDIGYTLQNRLDTVAAAAFIGGGSGFITTIYDQTSNAWHLQNTTAANQPAYAAAGLGGRPCADFDGVDDTLAITVAGRGLFRNIDRGAIVAAWKTDTLSGLARNYCLYSSTVSNTSLRAGAYVTTATSKFGAGGRRLDADAAVLLDGTLSTDSNPHIHTSIFDWRNSDLFVRMDGVLVGTQNTFQTAGSTTDVASGTIRLANGGTEFADCKIAEVIAFRTDYPSDFAALERNMGQHFGVAVA